MVRETSIRAYNNEERDGTISIGHTEIKKIYVDMKEKIVFGVSLSTQEKTRKEKEAILSTSIKIKDFNYIS